MTRHGATSIAGAATAGSGGPHEPDPDRGPQRHNLFGRGRTALTAVGPFGLALAVYSGVVEYVPDRWFQWSWLHYLFAALAAVASGAIARLLVHSLGTAAHTTDHDDRQYIAQDGAVQRGHATVIPRPRPAASVTAPTVSEIFAATRRRLLADLQDVHRDGFTLTGWPHHFGSALSPSANGTSYGLRAGLALDIRDARFDRHQLVETIMRLQLPGGGWVSRSQRDVPRPEVTSWVLTGAVAGGLESERRASSVKLLEGLLDVDADAVGMTRTTVVTAALSCLARTAPDSGAIAGLVQTIRGAALRHDGTGPSYAWAEALGSSQLRPSVAHTARVVVALSRARQTAAGQTLKLDDLIDGGIGWLDGHRDLALAEEPIRRPAGEMTDGLFVDHFTAAWVAQAVMAAERASQHEDLLRTAVRAVAEEQHNGIWTWPHHGTEPIWMTYQGIVVLRDYSLLNLPWLP